MYPGHSGNVEDNIFTFPNEVDDFILPFVKGHFNVDPDGNCGFRVIAYFQYGDQERWADVRRDLIEELTTHQEMYVIALGGSKTVYDNVMHNAALVSLTSTI